MKPFMDITPKAYAEIALQIAENYKQKHQKKVKLGNERLARVYPCFSVSILC